MKKNILTIAYSVALISLMSYNLFATIRYVSPSGNNTTGLSWTNAWTTITTHWGSLSAGDYVYFDGGVDSTVFSGGWEPTVSGSAAGGWIHLFAGRYSPSPSGHSGRVIISGGTMNIHLQNDAYYWIRGFELTNANTHSVYIEDTGSHNIIDSCYIHNFNYGNNADGYGIKIIARADSTIIRNCYIQDKVNGAGQSDILQINWDSGNHAHFPSRTIIHDNFFESRSQDPSAHNDVIQSIGCDGFIIYNNILISDSVNSQQGGGMPFILSDVNYGFDYPVIIFNNVAYMGGIWYVGGNYSKVMNTRHDSNGGAVATNQPSNVFLFNNTFINNGPTCSVVEQEYLIHYFSNNIVASWCPTDRAADWRFNLQGNGGYGGVTGRLHVDSTRNNLIWRERNTQTNLFTGSFNARGGGTFTPSTWSSWVSNNGTGVNADPQLVTKIGRNPNQSSLVPDILETSPAIGAGQNLTYKVNYLVTTFNLPDDIKQAMLRDFYGNLRGSSWDIGAVQYQQGGGSQFKIMGTTISKIQGVAPSKVWGIQ